jgi:hypothetical protein
MAGRLLRAEADRPTGVDRVAVGLFVAMGVSIGIVAWAVMSLDLDGPDYGTTSEALAELDRIETPAGASVLATDVQEDSGLVHASQTFSVASFPCSSDAAGLEREVLRAGFSPGIALDGGQRYLRDVEGRLTARLDILEAREPAAVCTLWLGFQEDAEG